MNAQLEQEQEDEQVIPEDVRTCPASQGMDGCGI